MKIECELPDIKRDEIIEAMAAGLLGAIYERYEDDPTPETPYDRKQIGKHLRAYLDGKIAELAAEVVRKAFDDTIRARIDSAVDVVLSEGWRATNEFGEPRGERIDLKARISKLLTEVRGDSYSRSPSVLDAHVQKAVENLVGKDFQPVIAAARENLKKCLDEKVMKTVSDTITNAVGLR